MAAAGISMPEGARRSSDGGGAAGGAAPPPADGVDQGDADAASALSPAQQAAACLRSTSARHAAALAAQRAALVAAAEDDGHKAADREALGLEVDHVALLVCSRRLSVASYGFAHLHQAALCRITTAGTALPGPGCEPRPGIGPGLLTNLHRPLPAPVGLRQPRVWPGQGTLFHQLVHERGACHV